MQRNPALTEKGARKAFGIHPKPSRIVPWTLATAFLSLAALTYIQNVVIHEQASVLARYENGARTMARLHESAILRADIALAAYDRCRGLRVVASP